MITASTAKANTDVVRLNLTYINNLITGSTATGSYYVIIEPKYVDDTMITSLSNTYGYKITPKTNDIGQYQYFLVSWD
jgi:hypothetical protein